MMRNMKKHIGYRIEATLDFSPNPMQFVGYITYFDGEQIVLTASDPFRERVDAWRWIGNTLKQWEEAGEVK